jgi:hypothetical protein
MSGTSFGRLTPDLDHERRGHRIDEPARGNTQMKNDSDEHGKDGSTNISDEDREYTESLPDGSTSDGSSAGSGSESGDTASGDPDQ